MTHRQTLLALVLLSLAWGGLSCGGDGDPTQDPVTPVPPPAAPSNLSAEAVSSSEIRLSWNDNSTNETSFRVERSADGSSSWAEIAEVGANTTTYTDAGLSPGTQYLYRVRARGSGGDSDYTAPANATTHRQTLEQAGTVGPSGAVVSVTTDGSPVKGAYVDIPAGALTSNMAIEIRQAQPLDPSALPSGVVYVDFLPDGLEFEVPVEIGLPLPEGSDGTGIQAYYLDRALEAWVEVETVRIDLAAGLLIARTIHFSEYVAKKGEARFNVDVYSTGGRITARVELLTPLEDIPSGSGFFQRVHNPPGTGMRTLLGSSAKNLQLRYELTLREKRLFRWLDRDVAIAGVHYYPAFPDAVSPPGAVGVRSLLEPGHEFSHVYGWHFRQSVETAELIMRGAGLLIPFEASLDPGKEYYIEAKTFFVNKYVALGERVPSLDSYRDPITIRSATFRLADLTEPPDANSNAIHDDFEVGVAVQTPSSPASGDILVSYEVRGPAWAEVVSIDVGYRSDTGRSGHADLISASVGTIRNNSENGRPSVIAYVPVGQHTFVWASNSVEGFNLPNQRQEDTRLMLSWSTFGAAASEGAAFSDEFVVDNTSIPGSVEFLNLVHPSGSTYQYKPAITITGLNEVGHVVGKYGESGYLPLAYFWNRVSEPMRIRPYLLSGYVTGNCSWFSSSPGISNGSQVFGSDLYQNWPGCSVRGFIWDPVHGDQPQGQLFRGVIDINGHGWVVGNRGIWPETTAWIWDENSGLRNLGSPGSQYFDIWPTAINNVSQVVGQAQNRSRLTPSGGALIDAWIWDPTNGMYALGVLAEGESYIPVGISDSGEVVGNCQQCIFLWTSVAGIRCLDSPPGGYTGTKAIRVNKFGQVLAIASLQGEQNLGHLLLWDAASGWRRLSGLEAIELSTYHSHYQHLNDRGQVAGQLADGRFFLWTPTH